MAMSPAEKSRRYRDRKRGAPPRKLQPHGTRAAVRRHERAGEPLCEACKEFEKDRQHALYLKRTGKQQPTSQTQQETET
jgi:hypothetical protein